MSGVDELTLFAVWRKFIYSRLPRGLSTQNLARRRPQLASEHTEHFCRSLPNPARIQTQYPVHQKAKAAFASSPCRVLAYLI